jgi:AcrR family transcriptional regulator
VRTPRQKRSKERVAHILDAARALIAERGSAGLRVQDVAAQAGVALGTLYQYFPNKAAIVQALGEAHMAQVHAMLGAHAAEPPADVDGFVEMVRAMGRDYFALYCEDPAIRDILMGTAVDKTLQDLDYLDTHRNTELLFAAVKGLLPRRSWRHAKRVLFLAIELTTASIRVALKEEPKEREKLFARSESMLTTALRAELTALGAR